MARRGVLYMVWGDSVGPVLERSLASLRQWHPDLPVHVERFDAEPGEEPWRGLLRKSRMLALSPFEETLFLDADTVVLGKLDFGFERAARFGIACVINECPWARRYRDRRLNGDLIEYNTGVLFFTRRARPVFEAWAACAETLDSAIEWVENGELKIMPFNDQAGFAKAVDDTNTQPFVLPLNWNFRPYFHRGFFGPIRIWHDYGEVPDWILRENASYNDPAARLRFCPLRFET